MSDTLFDLSGKTALITGSSQGLGLTIARGLGRAGARILLNGRDPEKLAHAVAQVSAEGITAAGYGFDVTDSNQIQKAAARMASENGDVHILVNNAGIQRRSPLEELAEEDWRAVIDTNLTSAFLTARAFVPRMIQRRSGKIINICSLMSELGRKTTGAYTAAKGGLRMLTRAMTVEWAPHNIQINGIGPGYFLTDMTRPLAEDAAFDGWIRGRTPAGRWGNPEELVGPAVFLASDAAAFVNGQILYVDGGLLAAV